MDMGSPIHNMTIIEFITISTTGNATDFGDLTFGQDHWSSGCSNATRAI